MVPYVHLLTVGAALSTMSVMLDFFFLPMPGFGGDKLYVEFEVRLPKDGTWRWKATNQGVDEDGVKSGVTQVSTTLGTDIK